MWAASSAAGPEQDAGWGLLLLPQGRLGPQLSAAQAMPLRNTLRPRPRRGGGGGRAGGQPAEWTSAMGYCLLGRSLVVLAHVLAPLRSACAHFLFFVVRFIVSFLIRSYIFVIFD